MHHNEETFSFVTPLVGSIITMLSYNTIDPNILYGFKIIFSLIMGGVGACLGEIIRQEIKGKYDKKRQLKWLEENKHKISPTIYEELKELINTKNK